MALCARPYTSSSNEATKDIKRVELSEVLTSRSLRRIISKIGHRMNHNIFQQWRRARLKHCKKATERWLIKHLACEIVCSWKKYMTEKSWWDSARRLCVVTAYCDRIPKMVTSVLTNRNMTACYKTSIKSNLILLFSIPSKTAALCSFKVKLKRNFNSRTAITLGNKLKGSNDEAAYYLSFFLSLSDQPCFCF